MPRLSVIIATRNAETTIGLCLQSLAEQTFRDWELLIVDAVSTDATVSIIRSYESQIDWWCSEPDLGIYDAWNKALAQARGEYVCFVGADDRWSDPEALERLFHALGDQITDLVTSRALPEDLSTKVSRPLGAAWNYRKLGRRMPVVHPGLLHHRSLFERFGHFEADYQIVGDLDFLLRLPETTRSVDVDTVSIIIGTNGVSRRRVFARLREQRAALSRCPRYGPLRAYLVWLDKLWRYPFARALGLPH